MRRRQTTCQRNSLAGVDVPSNVARLLVVLLVVGALSACGTAAAPPTASPPVPSATVPPPGAPVRITLADDGGTVTVPLGSAVALVLGTDQDWGNVTVSDTSVLAPDVGVMTLVRGTQWLGHAAKRGTATISAVGTMRCGAGTPCPALARLFRATVDVR